MSSLLSLLDVEPGQTCTVERMACEDVPVALKLQQLGLTPGAVLMFLRQSPMGDLLAFTFRGTFIALTRDAAACVHVRL